MRKLLLVGSRPGELVELLDHLVGGLRGLGPANLREAHVLRHGSRPRGDIGEERFALIGLDSVLGRVKFPVH